MKCELCERDATRHVEERGFCTLHYKEALEANARDVKRIQVEKARAFEERGADLRAEYWLGAKGFRR